MSLGCLSAFSKRHADATDPPMTPLAGSVRSYNAQPKKSAIRRHGELPSCTHSTASQQSSVSSLTTSTMLTQDVLVQVIQAFRSEAGDELTVQVGQRLRVLYCEGSWTYASTAYSIPGIGESCGFVPTEFCRRLSADQRNVKFADERPPRSATVSPRISADGRVHASSERQVSNAYSDVSSDAAFSRQTSDESSSSDYVMLRSPTKREQIGVDAGFPYAARVLYNFSDEAADHASVRRGEMLAVLAVHPNAPDWTLVQRKNGQQGLVPSCFLQAANNGALLTNLNSSAEDTVSCSTVTSQRTAPGSAGRGHDNVICYPTLETSQPEVASWVASTSRYEHHASPGHSTSSSDSGYAAVTSHPDRRNGTRSSTPATMHGMASKPSQAVPSSCASNPQSVPRLSPTGYRANSSPQGMPQHQPSSSNDSARGNDDMCDFPPPPDSVLLSTGGDDSSRSSGRRPHSQRKLAQRRPLGPQPERRASAVDELADKLVEMAAIANKSPTKGTAPGRPSPPPVAPKPASIRKPGSRSPSVRSTPSPQSTARPQSDECLLVVSRFQSDSANKLSVEKGDIVYGNAALAAESRGWVWVFSPRLNEHGFIPVVYTQKCNSDGTGGVVTEI